MDLISVAIFEVRREPLQEVQDFNDGLVREVAQRDGRFPGICEHGRCSTTRSRTPGGWRVGQGKDLKVKFLIELREVMLCGGSE